MANTPDDFEIFQEFLMEIEANPTDDYSISVKFWKKMANTADNFSRILIRILIEDAANPSDDFGIHLEFWFEFQLILKNAKSADCV